MHADIFFIISSVGFILLALLAAVALCYVILILRRWYRISRKIEDGMSTITEEAKTLLAALASHRLLAWLFGKKNGKREKA